ncbi:helix-turn-helix domain-containing protein [Sphingobacterium sp. UBA5980]|uniref:helix-turn-helix domain-containing protein n=1 Tax=Sphingobacterium sp. UBA5980 TaxID=1947504 RepID=UPI00257DACEE|nr:helix-turn-helix domain-containing protein [Sphingobacterium sp. UBA5980]
MQLDILTKEDLAQFRKELLDEIKTLFKQQRKEWIRSAEVRRLLNISGGTLQNLRINGTLQYTKIGGIMYYKLEDIERLLEKGGRP